LTSGVRICSGAPSNAPFNYQPSNCATAAIIIRACFFQAPAVSKISIDWSVNSAFGPSPPIWLERHSRHGGAPSASHPLNSQW
jgi:hypothetical protein